MDEHRLELLDTAVRDAQVRDRYWAKVWSGHGENWWWTGAIMRSGHGRFWIGQDRGRDVVVLAHRFGFALDHGVDALAAAPVLRHMCDEALCQRPEHLSAANDDRDNRLDWVLRRHRVGSPLRDTRGPAGRARAIRRAVLAGEDIAQVMREGMSDLDRRQLTLF